MKNDETATVKENLDALSTLLEWFDSDEFSIEASIEKFKEVKALSTIIEAQLDSFSNEIELVKTSFDSAA